MAALVALKIDEIERVKPVDVVDHHRSGVSTAETQEFCEYRFDAGNVCRNLGIAEELTRLILARRIADLGGAPANQHDWAVAGLLQLAQHHDAEQVADMQARRGAVEADIAGDALGSEQLVEAGFLGRLMDEAAGLKLPEDVRFHCAHGARPSEVSHSRKPVSGLRRECTGAEGR